MAAPKGTMPPNAGKGRGKGNLNASTKQTREAVAMFVDNNVDKLQAWLDQLANGIPSADGGYEVKPSPKDAAQIFLNVIEYHIPKLARTESTVENKGPPPVITVNLVRPD